MSKIEQLLKKLCPNGVEYKKLGDVLLSVHTGLNPRQNFRLNTEGATNYYVTVKEISSGKLLFSEKTDRIDDKAMSIIQNRSCLEMGDVLLSGIGTIGRVAVVEIPTNNFNCSESVYLLKPDNGKIISKYLGYILETRGVQKQWEKSSVGSTLKGIRKETLLNVLIPVPPLEIQREVVEVLDKFALLTAELTAELEKRKKQYEHYRRALLAEGNREQGIGNRCGVSNWPMVKLGEVCGSVSPSVKIKRLDYRETGLTPIVSQEIEYISGYCDLSDDKIPAGEYVCFGDHSEHIKYVNFAFVQGADGLKILKAKGGRVMAKFLYYVALAYYQRHDNYERHFKYFSETLVPLPPLAEQERIVKILDRFDKLCNDLTSGLPAEIVARKKQYEYYRDKLLSFKRAG